MELYILSFKQEIPLTSQILNFLSLSLHYILATVSLDLPRQRRQNVREKVIPKTNPGKLFKWGFFEREGHLVYRFAI
jgi:hypothetical protein